jgi:hypothetical protein
MLQIHCANHDDADAAWRMLLHVPNSDFKPCSLHLNGNELYVITRDPDGHQTSVPPAAPVAHTPQPSAAAPDAPSR